MNRLRLSSLNTSKSFMHSAKGSTWEDHKYVQRVDGTYYYPDSYQGGRHISDLKGSASDSKSDNKDENKPESEKLESWEKKFYSAVNKTMREKTGLFGVKDLSEIASDDYQDFRKTLSDFGVDTRKLSREEVERMRQKVSKHYGKKEDEEKLSDKDIENLAKEAIRGNFGNGQERKDRLGDNYQEVQDKVNELLRGSLGLSSVSISSTNNSTSSSTSSEKKLEEKDYEIFKRSTGNRGSKR